MAHFAQLDENNMVVNVIVVNNEVLNNEVYPVSEPIGVNFCQSLYGEGPVWKQTSYNKNFRYNFAGIGYYYDPARDAFIPPKPYYSWILDEQTCQWKAPIPYPNDGNDHYWDEANLQWV